MRKLLSVLLLTSICLLSTPEARAEMDPRVKMMLTMSGYGVVGGALLGTATLAFDGKARNIAKGASFGLYAGILLGGYILVTYEMKKAGIGLDRDYYPSSSGYYDQSNVSGPQFENVYNIAALETKKDPKTNPLFFMNFVNLDF